MQLILPKNLFGRTACVFLVASLLFAACHNGRSPGTSAVRVSLCELYQNPAAYDGKVITVVATLTRLPDGTYLYPGTPTSECGYSFIRVDTDHIQNSSLAELESPTVSSPGRKEFDLELIGTFDGKYSEPYDHFKYRLVPIEIKPLSGVRIGKLLGAA